MSSARDSAAATATASLQPQTASSIARLLREGATRLEHAGIPREVATTEARWLLEHTSSLRETELIAYPERVLPPEQVARYASAIARRAAREPYAYIVGKSHHHGRRFAVSRHVLVPRWETALLVELATAHLRQHAAASPRICDLGTGSGVMAVHMALDRPDADIVATDLSADALEVAQHNARNHGVASRIRFVQHDMTAPAIAADLGQFDIVLSNPPYIPTARLDRGELALEVTDWEPRIALDGGADGLAVLRPMIAQLPQLLKPTPASAAFIETDDTTAEECAALARQAMPDAHVAVLDDMAQRHRVVAVCYSAPAPVADAAAR